MARDFEEHKWTSFTPHYLVWVCPDSYHKSTECESQCIRRGRYCTPDPDGDTEKGYSGRDVVQVRGSPGGLGFKGLGLRVYGLHMQQQDQLHDIFTTVRPGLAGRRV